MQRLAGFSETRRADPVLASEMLRMRPAAARVGAMLRSKHCHSPAYAILATVMMAAEALVMMAAGALVALKLRRSVLRIEPGMPAQPFLRKSGWSAIRLLMEACAPEAPVT